MIPVVSVCIRPETSSDEELVTEKSRVGKTIYRCDRKKTDSTYDTDNDRTPET